jgi:hypothetical protein
LGKKPGEKNVVINFLFTLIILFLLFVNYGCKHKKGEADKNVEYKVIKENKSLETTWNEIFTDHQILEFTFSDPSMEIYRMGNLVINSKGEYIIQDPKARKNLHFDNQGRFIRHIGRYGEGPGEFIIGILATIDQHDHIYLYDVVKRKIIKYLFPDYSFGEEISLKVLQSFYTVIDPVGNFIVYSKDVLLKHKIVKCNPSGEILKQAFEPEDTNYINFITRFGLGIINPYFKKGVVFMNPQKYEIFVYDFDLNLKKVFMPLTPSKFFPYRESLPTSLPFYDFSPKHAKWWGKSLVPYEVKTIGEKMMIGVVAQFTKFSSKVYINIHDIDGNTYAKGLEIPFEGMIKFIKGKHIYIEEEDRINDKSEIVPPRLHRYTIKF